MTTILLVEDNFLIQDMLSERLEASGYRVISANNGAEAVEKAQSEQPDLILMDLGLPVMDGWQATVRLRDMLTTRHIPIIALTAHTTNTDRDRSLLAGCDEFEVKPVDFQRLQQKIERLVVK